ncbi:MAG: hypothetical protein CL908_18780 [Deltaproteobacteria bacterium]|nr:hypothetical protein [Deltaproteobacteria bacterium]
MASTALKLRAENDQDLARRILEDHDVRRVIEKIDEQAEKSETRRQLLATSVRLSPRLAPDLHRVMDACKEKLLVSTPLEIFVFPSAQYNAACVRPEEGRVFIMFSSELLEAFDNAELAFVAGHELGHHVFDHHSIPVGTLLRTPGAVSPRIAMKLFTWSRYAEVSADRVGHYCAEDIDAVARGLFKLASGLREGASAVVMKELLAQVDDLAAYDAAGADSAPRADWFSTHPFSPLRLKAAQLFQGSEHMTPGGVPPAELEVEVAKLMGIMEPGYLHDKSDAAKLMRRLLLAGAMAVAAASKDVSDREIEAIEGFLGEGKVTRTLDVDALRADLPRRMDAVVEATPPSKRAHVVRDLCVIARADGHVDDAERAVLETIAKGLKIGPEVVPSILDASLDLD